MAISTHNPGSAEAIANGCICPVLDNNRGKRAPFDDDKWWIRDDCPIHGMKGNDHE